jgi:hypothetical protein
MIYNVRTYNCIPRMLNKYVDIFEKYAMPVNNKYGFKLIGYFVSDIGPQNQIVHIWEYKDLNEFNEMRKKKSRRRWLVGLSREDSWNDCKPRR